MIILRLPFFFCFIYFKKKKFKKKIINNYLIPLFLFFKPFRCFNIFFKKKHLNQSINFLFFFDARYLILFFSFILHFIYKFGNILS
jgi:hypothetical protein